MANVLANEINITMLPLTTMDFIRVKKITPNEVPEDVVTVINHSDTARVVSGIIGFGVKPSHVGIKLTENDVLYLAHYTGPRLQEGATMLPEGANIEFFEVSFREEGCRGCRGYDTGSCQTCRLSFWLSGTPMKDC